VSNAFFAYSISFLLFSETYCLVNSSILNFTP
jgi:hypothetical protein